MSAVVLTLLGAALFARILLGHWKMWRALPLPPPVPAPRASAYPSITVIRPIRGLDEGCCQNTEALLEQDYPGDVQTLFVFDNAADPSYAPVARVAAASGKDAQLLIAGAPPRRRTGKLNAMIHGMAQARGELIAFCDSDSRPSPALLRLLVEALLDRPDAGATFAPAITLGKPSSFAEVAYGLMMNSWYGAAVAELAGRKRELPFIMGQVMVLRRSGLAAIGGLESAEGQLVDDMFLGTELAAAGFKNVMVRWPLHLVTGPLGLRELSALLRKWMAFSRSGLPSEFVLRNWLRGVELALALGFTVTALVLGYLGAAIVSALAVGLWVYSQVSLHRRFSGAPIPPRFVWVSLVLPFIVGILLVTTRVHRKVEWRGHSYQLDQTAKLDDSPYAAK